HDRARRVRRVHGEHGGRCRALPAPELLGPRPARVGRVGGPARRRPPPPGRRARDHRRGRARGAGPVSRTGRRAGVPVLAACLVLLTGCHNVSVNPTVTASVSPCFRVLPEAHAALGGQGKFVDVARIRGEAVSQFPRLPTTTTDTVVARGTATTLAPGRRDVCLVAYSG